MKAELAQQISRKFCKFYRPVRKQQSSKFLSLLFLSMLFSLTPLWGQGTEGNITGTVTTQDGATLANATVTVTNDGTNLSRVVTSNTKGDYEVTDLNPGSYTVKVTAAGFAEAKNAGVALASEQTLRIDVRLTIGSNTSSVNVTAGVSVIETEMPSISSTVTAQNLANTSSNLLSTSDTTGDSGLLFYTALLPGGAQAGGSFDWSMYGSRGSEAYYNVDGISSNSALYGNMVGPSLPPFGMIQEVQYSAVDNKAEMGQLLNISVITKSGTNAFHGDLYDNYNNSVLQARNYFANSVGHLIQNDFGANVGGPVLKNKLFFFASGEFLREAQPISIDPNLPTTAMRTGDFSALLQGPTPIVITDPYTGAPFPHNMIPSTMFSPAAVTWQNFFYPQPNFGPPTSFTANFRGTYPQNIYTNRYYLRTDYALSQNNTLFARVGYIRSSPEVLDSGLPPSITGYRVQKRHTWQGVLSDTWILNPQMVNVAKFGLTHTANDFGGALQGQALIDQLGITGLQTAPADNTGIPSVSISNFTSPYQLPQSEPTEQTVQFIDQLTYQRGSHTFKTGIEFRPMQAEQYFNPTFGSFAFNGDYTNFSYADFLLGLPATTGYTYPRTPQYSRFWYLNAFVQDDWKVRQNLTVSLGVRYEYNSPAVDKYNVIASFNPSNGDIVVPSESVAEQNINPVFNTTGIPIETAQTAGFPDRSMRYSFKLAAYPRVGFAYRPFSNDNTVIRGGYGIYNDEISAALFSYLYGGPFGVSVAYTNSIMNGQPLIDFQHPINSVAGGIGAGAVSVQAFDIHYRNPYVQQFNLTLEQNLGFGTGLRLSYVGTRAVKLTYTNNVNQVPASTTPFSQSATPYPLYYSVDLFKNGGYENYNALSAEINRPFHHGLSFEAALTWAKNLTDDDDTLANGIEGGVTAEDSFNLSRQKGNAEFTPRIGFVSNLIWQLPIGQGQWLLKGGNYAERLLGGWQISAAYLAQTGDFLTPTFNGLSPSNTNQFSGTAQRVSQNLNPVGNRSITNWFNAAAFAIPAQGTFGSGAFGTVEGPNMNALNAALFKSFPIFRESKFELRGSFTNVLNHTNFGDPDVAITDSSVGQITTTTLKSFGGPRSGLVSGRLIF
jgi:hypothetical protein